METMKRKMPGMGAVRKLHKTSLHMVDGGQDPLAPKPELLALQNGGMFDKLKRGLGMGPTETVTEKYARQDAERAGKAKPAPEAARPAAAPASSPGGIPSYVGNPVLDARMKAAGLKDGGDLQTGKGGAVPGKGHGDKIDAKYEPGEFVVSNDMLDMAPGLREHLHELRTHALAKKGMTPAMADAKAVHKGAIRALNGVTADEEQRRAQLLSQIPATGGSNPAPAPDGKDNTEFSRNVGNTLMALPGGAPALGAISTMARATPVIGNALAATGSGVGALATKAAPYAVPAAGVAALSAASSPASTVSERVPTTPPPPVGAIPKIAAIAPSQPAVPADTAVTPNTPTTQVSPGMSQPVIDQTLTNPDGSRWSAQDNATMAANLRDGIGPYTGTSRQQASSAPAAFDPSAAVRRLNDITSPEYEAMRRLKMASDPGRRSGETGRGARSRAQGAISQMADLQGEVLGGSRQQANAQMADATTRRGQDQTAVTQGAISKLARERLGLDAAKAGQDAKGANLDNESKAGVLAAQKALAAAKTPAERLAAEDTLRALQGKYGREPAPVRHLVVPGGQAMDANGQTYTMPSRVFNPDTQQFVDQAPAKAVGNFEQGKSYTDAKGNKATWDGQKFVPAK